MRDSFVRTLTELAAADPSVMLVTGDLGFGVLTKFAHRFPRQYLNAGVAEQNMTAIAVGLALEGRNVFTYSIGNFPTLRCLEQIRNDACYHQAKVRIVCIGGGFAYGSLGISHHATEDLAIMRALPGMTVFAPGDPWETEAATDAAYRTAGTCYLRLGRGGEKNVHSERPHLEGGRILRLAHGRDVTLLSTGGILAVANEARSQLVEMGIDAGLGSVPTLSPFDEDFIHEELKERRQLIATIEEHSVVGGLGGTVAEFLAETANRGTRLLRCGLNRQFSSTVGDQDFLREKYGLSAPKIAAAVVAAMRRGSKDS
ncbi:MAG TPA: transketolase C-terminal domain-containing protein [Opitutaceae bacterium]|nr:transketolase C-terminal domain-containing protein [Opitutaceae bacterium]